MKRNFIPFKGNKRNFIFFFSLRLAGACNFPVCLRNSIQEKHDLSCVWGLGGERKKRIAKSQETDDNL